MSSSKRRVTLAQEYVQFKAVVKNLMHEASKVLGEIELLSHGPEVEEKIALLNHYQDYVGRLCKSDSSNKSTVQSSFNIPEFKEDCS